MKRILSITILTTLLSWGVTAQSVRFTGIVDGDLSGGKPKGIELYVEGTVNLSSISIERSTNGGAFGSSTALSGTYTDTYVYLTNDTIMFDSVFTNTGVFTNRIQLSVISGNGNDAFRLTIMGVAFDQIAAQSSSYSYQDSYIYRKDSLGPDSTFNASDWTLAGNGYLDTFTYLQHRDSIPFGTWKPKSSAPPVCNDPTGLMVSQTSPTSVSVSWTSGSGLSHLEYDTTGFTKGSGTMVNNVTSSNAISGLTAGVTYDFYVQDTCANIGTSKWVGPIKFTLNASPKVTGIWRSSATNIMVAYNDSMNSASATSTSRYKGISGLSSVMLNNSNDTATLTYGAAFSDGMLNTLTVDSVMNSNSLMLDTNYMYSFVYNASKPSLVINEIMYNDPSGPDTLEYLEILNNGSSSASLGGLTFGQGITHEFAAGTNLAAGAYLVVSKSSSAIMSVFGVSSTQWDGGGLSNGGEDVLIWNTEKDTIDYVNYDDGNGWSTDPDGQGYSLVLCDPSTDNNDPTSWGTEPAKFGTSGMYVSPGAMNTCRPPFVPPLRAIAPLKTFDANGEIDSNGVKCAIEGIVVTDNMSDAGSFPKVSFVIVDEMNTAGLTAISFDDTSVINYTPHLGDSIRIFGKVDQFNGLAQFRIDSVTTYKTMVKIPNPYRTDTLGELTESRFIEMMEVFIPDTSQWPAVGSDATVQIVNSKGDTLDMRVDKHTNVSAMWPNAPTGKFRLKGVGGQYDSRSPYFDGYQVFPRFYTDIDTTPLPPCTPPTALSTANIKDSSVDVSWTSPGTMWNIGWSLGHTSTAADIVDSVMGITTNPYTITGLNPLQHYHIYVQEVCGPDHSMWSAPTMFTTTSLENVNSNKTALVAFPNPNNIGEVRFNMEVSVTIRNILGQTVKSANEVTSLDISDLDSGVYLIQSEQGDTIRFIVE